VELANTGEEKSFKGSVEDELELKRAGDDSENKQDVPWYYQDPPCLGCY